MTGNPYLSPRSSNDDPNEGPRRSDKNLVDFAGLVAGTVIGGLISFLLGNLLANGFFREPRFSGEYISELMAVATPLGFLFLVFGGLGGAFIGFSIRGFLYWAREYCARRK